jgi:hypothetical protein
MQLFQRKNKMNWSLPLILILFSQFTLLEKCKINPLEDNGPGLNEPDLLRGYTHSEYGNSDNNPCVNNLLSQLESLSTDNDESSVYKFNSSDLGLTMNIFKHPQGIARIPGIENENWMLITKNHLTNENEAGVISILFDDINSNGDAWQNQPKSGPGKMEQFYTTNDNKHPGGCQLIGHQLAVAHETATDDTADPTWISFYDVSNPEHISESNRFCFNGIDAVGNPYFLTNKGQAICVGLTKLENGKYLMLALESRRRLPSDVGWFFISTTDNLKNTDWEFIQFWHQDDLLPAKNEFRTYENINLVTDCADGNIYMLGFYGKGKSNAIDVFHITTNIDNTITLEKVFEKKVKTRSGGASFRAGASIHITPDNKLVLYCVEKADSGKWLTIEEFTQKKIESEIQSSLIIPSN